MSVPTPPPPWFASTLAAYVERRDLDGIRTCELMHGLVGGAWARRRRPPCWSRWP